jgi:hypothetical protein
MDAQDIMIDSTGDLVIDNGDFKIGKSDGQHIECILRSSEGHFKEFPLCGADIQSAINGIIDGAYRKKVRLQLVRDGYKVKTVDYTNSILSIDATR